MLKRNTAIIILAVVVVGILTILLFNFDGSISSDGDSGSTDGSSDLDRLSELTFADYDGNVVSLADFDEDKMLVLNSWAVWCPFCVDELPRFAQLQEEFAEEIVIIAIDRAEPLDKVKGFTDELGVTDDMVFLMDKKDSFFKKIGGFAMPETIFIDINGDIVLHKRGPMTLEEMRTITSNLIAQQ